MIIIEFLLISGAVAVLALAASAAYKLGRKVQKEEDSQ